MTNSDKAKERAMQVFPCPNEYEQRRLAELVYNDACNWKDKQLKEYLEKKKAELNSHNHEDEWFNVEIDDGKMRMLNEIINELFGE